MRFDDLDTPRNAPGAVQAILLELTRLGLDWDESPVYSSTDPQRYQSALDRLGIRGLAFPCACSRKDVGRGIYPGTCRNGLAPGRTAHSLRLRVADARVEFKDRVQGNYAADLDFEPGDFVILRGDGIIAYHLATVMDDAAAGVNSVVRGADLLASTPRQIYIQNCLGLPTPDYAHLPVAVNTQGQKLSKQTHAVPSHGMDAAQLWRRSLEFLGQGVPPPERATVSALREHGLRHWRLGRVPVGQVEEGEKVSEK